MKAACIFAVVYCFQLFLIILNTFYIQKTRFLNFNKCGCPLPATATNKDGG